MGLEIIKEINVDFYNTKYISVNAKQYDIGRYISVTCYNQGALFPIDNTSNYAYVRYRKADGLNVFNSCSITEDGSILVELTEQMLAFAGRAYADIVVVHDESVPPESVTVNTGELLANNASIISTMLLTVNVMGSVLNYEEVESSEEYNALNDLLIKATTDYEYVMAAAKVSEENALSSEKNAKESEENAKTFADAAKVSEENAKISETNANLSEENAKVSEENAKLAEENAKLAEENAKESEAVVILNAEEAMQSANAAADSAELASNQVELSYNNAMLAKSYAMGETSVRVDEDIDNSKYYYIQAKAIKNSIEGGFIVMGSINFEELATVEKQVGYIYHIKDSFTTDDTFKEGAGISYSAGANIYYTNDGYWDTLIGGTSITVSDDDNGNVTLLF